MAVAAQARRCEQFRALLKPDTTPFDVALAVAGVIREEFNREAVGDLLEHMTQPLLQQSAGADALLQWFADQGFSGPADGVMRPQHSDIAWVLEHRCGIPITLAVLLMETARRLGMDAQGINFPGHFLARIDHRIADPLGMSWVSAQDLRRAGPDALQPVGVTMLGLRMLNNLKVPAAQAGQWVQVLDLLELQLILAEPQQELSAPLQLERGEAWEELGGVDAARQAYLICARTSRRQDLRLRAEARLEQLPPGDMTVH